MFSIAGWRNYKYMLRGLLVLLLVSPFISYNANAKTLERSCKGAWLIKYNVANKNQAITGPFTITAKGTSKGTVPSPVKARERACQAAAQRAADSINEKQAIVQICKKQSNGRGSMTYLGGVGRSKGESKTHNRKIRSQSFECRNGRVYTRPICGNGRKEGLEECDRGQNNSDTKPDKCRTNCTLADCGDSVVDNGEQCDDGSRNHNLIPGACRTSCKQAFCGDGVLDVMEGEKCDDGNMNGQDGCHQCQRCVAPKNDLNINEDTKLCYGNFNVNDTQDNGAIIVSADNVTLDCRGSRLRGSNRKGKGIVVTGSNVVLRGCDVGGYATGIEIKNKGAVIFDNLVCGNSTDMTTNTTNLFAVKNRCNSTNNIWQEDDKEGCSLSCQ